ncbi:MAG: hypothetical protein AAF292_05420 [Pseudomonadota bacterium]
MLKRLTQIVLASIAFIGLPQSASAFGIGLQPTTVEITVEPGDTNRQIVNIANVHQEKTISLTLGLADWDLDETGQIRLSPPGESGKSAATWTRFSPAFLTLKPGETEQVIVDMATPTRLSRSGDFRFALLASTILPEERTGQSGVWKKYQIASLFYLTAGNASSTPVIQNSEVIIDEASGNRVLNMEITNDGNSHARLTGTIEINGDGGKTSLDVGNLVVLDEAKRSYSTVLPEGTTGNAVINVYLNNTHAPQSPGAKEVLPPHSVVTASKRAALDVEPQP